MVRGASLSDGCTPNRCDNSILAKPVCRSLVHAARCVSVSVISQRNMIVLIFAATRGSSK